MSEHPDSPAARSGPLVSVIIIFLNGERYIAEAIDSVLAQDLADWELILIDDGSSDGATAIARRYAEADPGRIRLAEHPGHENRGMSASRNAGLALARGRYVAFLDADDIWLPARLGHHVAILEARPDVAMSMGPTLLWSGWDRPPGAERRPWLAADIPTDLGLPVMQPLEPPIVAIGFLEKRGGNVPGICSLLVRREALLAVGGFEDRFRTLYEDQVFFFKICLAYRVIATDRILDRYRQHPGSACHQAGGMSGDAAMRPVFLDWLQGYMIDRGIKSRRLWAAFRAEMLRFDRPRLWGLINLPRDLIDRFNVASRRFVIALLTPRVYTWLRRRLRLSVVDVTDVR
ncbi:MAG: glycosyl transferase family 2 [Alphaproteobacteria bacterium HGW-Alphaproteobacteria-6]|nr:MAG: glycosyl transferase family 2 [Alphaproteobacteria bacterium HGW-Alphaproteobacteria-6]